MVELCTGAFPSLNAIFLLPGVQKSRSSPRTGTEIIPIQVISVNIPVSSQIHIPQPPGQVLGERHITMPFVIFPCNIDRPCSRDLWPPNPSQCYCGRYAFYLECGHLSGQPELRKRGGNWNGNGRIVVCYPLVPLIHVYNLTVAARCRNYRNRTWPMARDIPPRHSLTVT